MPSGSITQFSLFNINIRILLLQSFHVHVRIPLQQTADVPEITAETKLQINMHSQR